jgi:hypothetical protein
VNRGRGIKQQHAHRTLPRNAARRRTTEVFPLRMQMDVFGVQQIRDYPSLDGNPNRFLRNATRAKRHGLAPDLCFACSIR